MSQKTQAEVHHQEPRHYFEAPLLLIMAGSVPEEWVVKLDHGCAIPVCRYDFTEDGRAPERPTPDTKELPLYAIEALAEYDGQYSDEFDKIWTFQGPARTPDELLSQR